MSLSVACHTIILNVAYARMLRILQIMCSARRATPYHMYEAYSVQLDDFVVAGWETTSLCGPLIHHLNVSIITIVIGTVSLACLGLFLLELSYPVSFCLDSRG
jgi:hypothetical protein